MIPCMFQSVVEMVDDETARYIMEQMTAGDGSGDNLPLSYTDEEGTQADMFLNMSADGNEEHEPQQHLAVAEGSGEVYMNCIVSRHRYYYVLVNES